MQVTRSLGDERPPVDIALHGDPQGSLLDGIGARQTRGARGLGAFGVGIFVGLLILAIGSNLPFQVGAIKNDHRGGLQGFLEHEGPFLGGARQVMPMVRGSVPRRKRVDHRLTQAQVALDDGFFAGPARGPTGLRRFDGVSHGFSAEFDVDDSPQP